MNGSRPATGPISLLLPPGVKVPTLEQLAEQAAKEQGTSPLAVSATVADSYNAVTWVMGHGLPYSLRRAQDSARNIRGMR